MSEFTWVPCSECGKPYPVWIGKDDSPERPYHHDVRCSTHEELLKGEMKDV